MKTKAEKTSVTDIKSIDWFDPVNAKHINRIKWALIACSGDANEDASEEVEMLRYIEKQIRSNACYQPEQHNRG